MPASARSEIMLLECDLILYFAGAKQSGTRVARIERYTRKILDGKGFHGR